MLGTRSIAIALLSLAAAAACDNSSGTGSLATLRVANATNTGIDVASAGLVATGNANIGFAGSSSCVVTNVFAPDITVSPTGTTNTFSAFAPNLLLAGQTYVIVAFPGFANATEFAFITTNFPPPAGQSGLRVFNAAAGSGPLDVFITAPGAALGAPSATGIGFRTATGFITVPPGPIQIRLTITGTQTVVVNVGTLTLTPDLVSVLVIAPPAPGTTALRSFLVPGC
jgi:hypothetical protein